MAPGDSAHERDRVSPAQSQDEGDEILPVGLTLKIRRRTLRRLLWGLGLLAFLAVMAATNPAEEDFSRQYTALVKAKVKGSSNLLKHLGAALAPIGAAVRCERRSFFFFSVFTWTNRDGSKVHRLGAFGRVWFLALEDKD